MRNIFDRLVRRDDRLQLLDGAGEKQCTTAGPLTDHADPDVLPSDRVMLSEALTRIDVLARRLKDLEDRTRENNDDALSFAGSVGSEHLELKNCLADLRRDFETLAAQVDETAQAVAKLATAQPVANRDQVAETYCDAAAFLRDKLVELEDRVSADKRGALSHAASVGELYGDLRRDLETLAAEFADSLGEISRLRKQGDETAKAVAKLVANLSFVFGG